MTEDIFYGFLAFLFVWMVDICLMDPISCEEDTDNETK